MAKISVWDLIVRKFKKTKTKGSGGSLPVQANVLVPPEGTPVSPAYERLYVALRAGEMAPYLEAAGLENLEQRLFAPVRLPSGEIAAYDPLSMFEEPEPFIGKVVPGEYPVWLHICERAYEDGIGHRVAFAEIRFTENKPVRFLLARTPGNQDTELAPGEFVGYGVDSGTGCFADARMAEYQQSLEEEEQEAFIDELTDLLMESDPGAYSALDYSPEGAPANLVAFSSGEGDGGYGSYWGFDENGVLCCLLTDFGSFYLTD